MRVNPHVPAKLATTAAGSLTRKGWSRDEAKSLALRAETGDMGKSWQKLKRKPLRSSQSSSAGDLQVDMASSARRWRTARARKLLAVALSSWSSCPSSCAGSVPSRAATARATRLRKAADCGSQAAVVSATRGKKTTPCARHSSAVRRCAFLVSTYAVAAATACREAAPRVSCR